MQRLFRSIGILALSSAAFAQGTASSLPRVFSGWELRSHQTVTDPAKLPEALPQPALQEFGFQSAETATYIRDGATLPVDIWHFKDAIGAYGGFTTMRSRSMQPTDVCDGGASIGDTVLFECSNLVVKATFPQTSAMTASELRDLAAQLPKLSGQENEPPNIAQFIPSELQSKAEYVLGPETWKNAGGVVPPEVLGFAEYHPEALVAQTSADEDATLSVLKYPTPQIALLEIKKINQWHGAQQQGTFVIRRSGPLVAVVIGDISMDRAKMLAERVHYGAEVSWDEQTSVTPKNNIANLVYNIALLALILGVAAVFVGIMFGGFRLALKRLFPGRFIDRPEDVEFIQLNLKD